MSDVVIKEVAEMTVACVTHVGPYWEFPNAMEVLQKWISSKSIKPTGAPTGLYYDDPRQVEMDKLKSEAIIQVDEGITGEGDVEIKKLPKCKHVCLIYKGSYYDVAKRKAYQELYDYIKQENLSYEENLPVREVYLNSPAEVKQEDLETEIQVPIK